MRRTLTTLLVLSLLVVGSLTLAFSGGLKLVQAQTAASATGSISGTVTDKASGGAIAGAWVFYWSRGDVGIQAVGAVTTDSAGKYSIADVPQGEYELTIVAVGYKQERGAISLEGVVTLNLALTKPSPKPTGALSGTVTDAANGSAIAGARVQYFSKSPATPTEKSEDSFKLRGGVAKTDDSGAYSADKVLEGTYTVTVVAKGYVPQTKEDVKVTAGQTTTAVDFALAKVQTSTVSGSVKDQADGKPIAGAKVLLLPTAPHLGLGPGANHKATSDDSGNFTIAAVPEGTYVAMAHAPGYRPETERDIAVTAGATTTVEFSLEAGGSIHPFKDGEGHEDRMGPNGFLRPRDDDDDDRGNPMGPGPKGPKLERMERPGLGLSGRAHGEVEDD